MTYSKNKSIGNLKNYLKTAIQYRRFYLADESKEESELFSEYGLQYIKPLNYRRRSYQTAVISKDDGILLKGNVPIRYWLTDDRETLYINKGRYTYKKCKNKPLEEVRKLYNMEFAQAFSDKALMFSSEFEGFYILRLLCLNDGRISKEEYVDNFRKMSCLKCGIEIERNKEFQYFYLDAKNKIKITEHFKTMIRDSDEGYQPICCEDGKYRFFEISKISGIEQVGDQTDVFTRVERVYNIPGLSYAGDINSEKSKIFRKVENGKFEGYEIPGNQIEKLGISFGRTFCQSFEEKCVQKGNKTIIKKYVHLIVLSIEGKLLKKRTYEGDNLEVWIDLKDDKINEFEPKIKINPKNFQS